MAKFVVFAKRVDPAEARLRVFCMTDDREDKTLEQQEHFSEVAKSRDVEVLENKVQYLELAGNLIAITKSGDQLQFPFKAFKENRLPFSVRVKDQHADSLGRCLFMREPKIVKGESPQQPICILNIVLPEDIIPDQFSVLDDSHEIITRLELTQRVRKHPSDYSRVVELRTSDISNLLGDDWVKLASEIGITEPEIESIIEEFPNSTAQQAQAMLKLFQSKKLNDINILENGLRAINRDDIVDQCMLQQLVQSTTTTTTTVTKRQPSKRTGHDTNGYEDTDLIKDSESLEELQKGKRYARYEHDESKYSAEEKAVEESESDSETSPKPVAQRREKIVKRLSAERQIPASNQKKEIVEEIITIKRQSLIDDTRAKHEDEILMQKPIDNSYKSTVVPETITKLKTTTLDSSNVDKSDFDKELQDKFQKTLGDVEKFEHKFTTNIIPTTGNFLSQEIQQTSGQFSGLPEKTSQTITTKTTTVTSESSAPSSGEFHTNGRFNVEESDDSPIVKKREIITSTYTDEDGYVKESKTIYDDSDDQQFNSKFMDPSEVNDILEEARNKADNIQSKITKNTTTTVDDGTDGSTTKVTTTTTTIRTIESINLDDVVEATRNRDFYDDDDEELIQRKMVESGLNSTLQ